MENLLSFGDNYLFNTISTCFICCNDVPAPIPISTQTLLNYLEIKREEILNDCKNSDKELFVIVCAKCRNTLEQFSELFRQLENIKVEMNCLVDVIKNGIDCSGEDFQDMIGNNKVFLGKDLAENLRKLISARCTVFERKTKEMEGLKTTTVKLNMAEDVKPKIEEDFDKFSAEENGTDPLGETEEEKSDYFEDEDGNVILVDEDESDEDFNYSEDETPATDPLAETEDVPETTKVEQLNSSSVPKPGSSKSGSGASLALDDKRKRGPLLNEGKYKCDEDECDLRFPTRALFDKHRRQDHLMKKSFSCEFCGKSFSTLWNLQPHRTLCNLRLKKETKKIIFPCDICKKTFETDNILKIHRLHAHLSKTISCDLCPKKFRKMSYLMCHKTMVHDARKFICKVERCRAKCPTKYEMCRHYERSHSDVKVPEEFVSTGEKRTYRHTPSVWKNCTLVTVSGEQKIECNLCKSLLKDTSVFLYHFNYVHGPKDHKCEACEKTFSTKRGLQNHRLTHKDALDDGTKSAIANSLSESNIS